MIKKLLGLVVVVVVLGGGAFYWFVIRTPAPKKLSITSGSVGGSKVTDSGQSVAVTGNWAVQASTDTTVGLRINQTFIGGIAQHTAVGRTAAVTGSLAIAGTKITATTITADLSALEFTDSPPGLDVSNRKRSLEQSGLQLATFPTVSFTLTSPIDLGTIPKAGTQVAEKATGKLTLHGVTKTVTFTVDAEIANGKIEVASANPVALLLADYNIQPPTFGPVADVSKTGYFEFKLVFAKS